MNDGEATLAEMRKGWEMLKDQGWTFHQHGTDDILVVKGAEQVVISSYAQMSQFVRSRRTDASELGQDQGTITHG